MLYGSDFRNEFFHDAFMFGGHVLDQRFSSFHGIQIGDEPKTLFGRPVY